MVEDGFIYDRQRITGIQLIGNAKREVCTAHKAGVKRKARDRNDSTHHIMCDAIDTATESAVLKLPRLDKELSTISLWPYYSADYNFRTQSNVEMLSASQIWLADGTFKTAPSLFAQV